MTSIQRHSDSGPSFESGTIGLLRVLIDNHRLLWLYPLAISVLVVLISFAFPNYYRSTITILPPERDFQSSTQPTTDFKAFLSGGMALPLMATPSDILAAVLSSRAVLESTITSLELEERWHTDRRNALELLRARKSAKVAPTGIIEFWAEDQDRWFADTLGNTLVSIADRINQSIVNTKASRTRQFVEERLHDTRVQLDSAARALERFQQTYKTVALDVEFKAMIEGTATVRAQMTADEIELSVLRETLSPDHPRIRALETRVAQTKEKLSVMESPAAGDTNRAFLGIGLTELPRLSQELAVRLRDVKVAESLYELLTQQFEHARIQERRDTPTFSVLDWAAHGGAKVRPKRAYLGLGTLFVAFLLMAAFVLARAYMARLELVDPIRHASIVSLLQSVTPGRSGRTREISH